MSHVVELGGRRALSRRAKGVSTHHGMIIIYCICRARYPTDLAAKKKDVEIIAVYQSSLSAPQDRNQCTPYKETKSSTIRSRTTKPVTQEWGEAWLGGAVEAMLAAVGDEHFET